jgi:hypothetical protein
MASWMQFIFAFIFFSFGRLDFAAFTLSFMCGLLLHVEGAVVASSYFGMGGVRQASFSVECVLDPQHRRHQLD